MLGKWRRAFTVLFFFLVAACSGGGCSSGCAGCGVTPLSNGFPTDKQITNAATARVTRSGLDFIAGNAATLVADVLKTSGTSGDILYGINTSSTSLGGVATATICSTGPSTTTTPPECEVDVQIGNSTFHVDAVAAGTGYTFPPCLQDGSCPSPTPSPVTISEPSLVVSGTMKMRLQDLPIHVDISAIGLGFDITASLGQNFMCSGGTATSDYADLPIAVAIPLVTETIPPRTGFTKIDPSNLQVYVGLQSSNIYLCSTCGTICSIIPGCSGLCTTALNDLVGAVFNFVEPTLVSTVASTVQKQLCTKPNPMQTPVCPVGSSPSSDGSECMYDASPGTCVPFLLGTEGHVDLSSAVAKLSPGTTGALDFLFAAGGDMIPAPSSPVDDVGYTGHTPNGMTLGFIGGATPAPQTQCVPLYNNTVPTGIPIPTELETNTVTPWPSSDPTGPQFGFAIAERFINYALGSVYNSGLLCLGITTASESLLQSAYLSLIIPSIKDLTFEWGRAPANPAAVAVVTRPQVPPKVTVGDGTSKSPLLNVEADQFAVDFYVFSEDRFVRILTYQADITVPVNISTAVTSTNPQGGLLPQIGTITAKNAMVTNSELLLDSPSSIAGAITGLLGALGGTVGGSIKPINLASALASYGIKLTIPDGGLRKVTEGSDRFLGIFGDLAVGPPSPLPPVHLKLTSKTVDASAMALATYDRAKLPKLGVHIAADDGVEGPLEYAYMLDHGTRSAWFSTPDPVIQEEDELFLQGNHVLSVVARRVGHPETETAVAAEIPFTIDVLPPSLEVTATSGGAKIQAYDFVTAQKDLVGRYQTTDFAGAQSEWTEWASVASLASVTLPATAASLTVQARDQEGNVGSYSIDLIRGRPNPAQASSSCGCSTPGRPVGTPVSGVAWAFGLAVAIVLRSVARKKRGSRQAARGARESGGGALDGSAAEGARGFDVAQRGKLAAALSLTAMATFGLLAAGCNCGGGGFTGNDSGKESGGDSPLGPMCGSTCNQPCMGALPPGLVGAYTSTAKANDGTVWVAGYNDSAISKDFSGLYGDLVVGKLDTAKNQVAWVTVDGVPALPKGTCPDYDPTGWRHGVPDPGNDVGLWTSIQMDATDHPIVSYYDATNHALKFASSQDGQKWNVYTVMQAAHSDIGRYSKMLVVGGTPTIAFLIMEPGPMGKMRSKVEVATATSKTPNSASDWTFEDAAVDNNGPCRAQFCNPPAVCVASTGQCETPVSGCKGSCDGGVCVDVEGGPSCQAQLAPTYIDIYPNAFGDYITMSDGPNGLGIVVYDRIDGLLEGVWKTGSTWQSQVIDGWTQPRKPMPGPDGGASTVTDTGDVGVGASLFISKTGDWHISYVNGTTEALQYILVPGGGKPTDYPEIVDNGLSLDGTAFPDGLHIVGDDSFIMVDDHNVVTIRYQDATAGTLRFATGTPQAGGKHQWSFHAVSQPGKFAGFFPHQLAGETNVANWWRQTDPSTGDITGDVSFVKPN